MAASAEEGRKRRKIGLGLIFVFGRTFYFSLFAGVDAQSLGCKRNYIGDGDFFSPLNDGNKYEQVHSDIPIIYCEKKKTYVNYCRCYNVKFFDSPKKKIFF